MKKVATITFGYSQNLGALLQAYALQRYIKELGYETKLIKFKEFDNRPFETVKGILDALSDIVFFFDCKKKIRKINEFRNDYLQFTNKLYQSTEDMKELNDEFDVFVAGSDQIWNVHKGIIDEFFLSFVSSKKRKVAYSASFGLSSLPEQYVDGVKRGLERFDNISIREDSGVRIAQDLTGIKYELTLDPVFLIPKHEWELLCKERIIQQKYIFVYPTQITELLVNTVKKAKKEMNCKVYSLFSFRGVDKVVKDADPIDFINYVRNADLIIGSSFHATAFSLIYEKNLRVIPHSTTGSRVVDLLKELGLDKKCVIGNLADAEFSTIDYSDVKERLSSRIEKSKEYLMNALDYKPEAI